MRTGYRICRWLSRMILVFIFRGRVFNTRHVPRTGGVLLVSNHQSFLDPVLATLAIPRECHYMARDTLFNHWLSRTVFTYLNAFAVKRGTADTRAIKELIRRLRAGDVVLTFPEATRSADGTVGAMRAGVILVARKTKVPIVPMVLLGAFEAWPRTAKLPRPRPLLVAYGAPVYPHEHPEWDDEQCISHVRAQVIALKRHYERHTLLRSNDQRSEINDQRSTIGDP